MTSDLEVVQYLIGKRRIKACPTGHALVWADWGDGVEKVKRFPFWEFFVHASFSGSTKKIELGHGVLDGKRGTFKGYNKKGTDYRQLDFDTNRLDRVLWMAIEPNVFCFVLERLKVEPKKKARKR